MRVSFPIPLLPSAALLFFCLLCCACAKSTVPLVYSSSAETTLPTAGASTVLVVPFTDSRPIAQIGKRSDGSDFMPDSNLSNWVTHALIAELSRSGIIVVATESEARAFTGGARYVATGSLDDVWLEEKSPTEYEARILATLALKTPERTLFTRSYRSSISKRVLPLPSAPEEVLADALRELALPMVQTIKEHLRQ